MNGPLGILAIALHGTACSSAVLVVPRMKKAIAG